MLFNLAPASEPCSTPPWPLDTCPARCRRSSDPPRGLRGPRPPGAAGLLRGQEEAHEPPAERWRQDSLAPSKKPSGRLAVCQSRSQPAEELRRDGSPHSEERRSRLASAASVPASRAVLQAGSHIRAGRIPRALAASLFQKGGGGCSPRPARACGRRALLCPRLRHSSQRHVAAAAQAAAGSAAGSCRDAPGGSH